MSAGAPALTTALLAFLSGVPALVYQVVWTRQVALLAGGQIGAISVVLVAFFGGLALGARWFGPLADRSPTPLRLYAALEMGAGALAAATVWGLGALADQPLLDGPALLAGAALLLLPATVLLGGTLPALLRVAAPDPLAAAGHAGTLTGMNTAGSVAGVAVAVAAIPAVGLRASLLSAAAAAVAVGCAAAAAARRLARPPTASPSIPPIAPGVLGAAFLVGAATLGFEVLATRLATLRLGSSLYAWGLVLALFLVGLAAGNLAVARRARTTTSPGTDLGWIEVAAACSVAFGVALLRPDVATPASGISPFNLVRVALGVLPAALCMGGAFPLLVRHAVRDSHIGGAFGRLAAVNTLGGIAGALLAPFALLPWIGSVGAALAFAAANALVGLLFLAGAASGAGRRAALAGLVLVAACLPALRRPAPAADPWVLFVGEGRQATAVVTGSWGDRTLVVDGDPEASTAGDARRTEELLAVLPLLLHPDPTRFLEVGLGSGITLGTAARFGLERLDCVEIARSVIRAARFFEPDNRGVVSGGAATIVHADARRLLARTVATYDVVSANTLHPWSVGATGLYSREYFARIAAALRSGGIAVQWIPTEQIGGDSFALILRTFFDVFPHGGLWWGSGNVIAVGSLEPLSRYDPVRAGARLADAGLSWRRLGWEDAGSLSSQQIATADAARAALAGGEVLVDDRPVLETRAARRRDQQISAGIMETLAGLARQGRADDAMLLWFESLALRAGGDAAGADAREGVAAELGLPAARRAVASRRVRRAQQDLREGRLDAASEGFRAALAADPGHRSALFGRAGLAAQRGEIEAAIRDLEALLAVWPDDARAWNELAGLRIRKGDPAGALRAAERALAANPFDLGALANAGLIALETGDAPRARRMLERIRAISPLGTSAQEAALAAALARRGGGSSA